MPERALLVPTAERDPAIGLAMFGPVFRGVRALMYNSLEERAMIQHVAQTTDVPGVVVGIGSEVPEDPRAERFRQQFGIDAALRRLRGPHRREQGMHGALRLLRALQPHRSRRACTWCSIGKSILPIPQHPRIHHLGFLADEQKFDAMAAADVLLMPSYFESLSMVALEAWAIGKPVLANGRCDVLKGQVIRSNAGLYYENYAEFVEALHAITSARALRRVARRERTHVLPHALRLARHRAEVPGHAGPARTRSATAPPSADGAAAGILRAPRAARCRRPRTWLQACPAGAVLA